MKERTKSGKIFALHKKPNKQPEICLIERDLKVFNAMIDGKREIIPFPTMPEVAVIFDAKAVASNKKPNCFLAEYDDLILGSILYVAIDNEVGFVSLNEEQVDKLMQYLKANDASNFSGNVAEKIRLEYLSNTDDTYVFSFLSEVKTKYKTAKIKWLKK